MQGCHLRLNPSLEIWCKSMTTHYINYLWRDLTSVHHYKIWTLIEIEEPTKIWLMNQQKLQRNVNIFSCTMPFSIHATCSFPNNGCVQVPPVVGALLLPTEVVCNASPWSTWCSILASFAVYLYLTILNPNKNSDAISATDPRAMPRTISKILFLLCKNWYWSKSWRHVFWSRCKIWAQARGNRFNNKRKITLVICW